MKNIISFLKENRLWYILWTSVCFLVILPLFGIYIEGNLLFPYCLYLMFYLVAVALSWYAEGQGANLLTVITVSFLIASSALVQSVLEASTLQGTTDEWSEKLIFIAIIAIVFCGMFILLRNTVLRMFGRYVVWITGALALLGLIVCFINPGKNGAKNWTEIAGVSIQITEIVKFFGVLFFGGVLLTEYSERTKFWLMTIFMIICAIGLMIVINEMGTMMVLGLVYIALVFGYIKSWECKTILLIALAFMVGAFMWFYKDIDSVASHWICHQGCTDVSKVPKTDEKGEPVKNEKGEIVYEKTPYVVKGDSGRYCDKCLKLGKYTHVRELDPTFVCNFCHFTRFDNDENYNELYQRSFVEGVGWVQLKICDNCPESKVIKFVYDLPFIRVGQVTKIYDRFAVCFDYAKSENMGFAEQIRDGIRAAKLGGVLGTTEIQNMKIINGENDSIVVAIAYRMGMLWVLLILLAYYILFLGIRNARSPVKTGVILALCIQTLVTYAGNFNFFALSGIGIPIISSGGSIFAVSLAFVFIIYTRDSRCKKEKKVIKEELI